MKTTMPLSKPIRALVLQTEELLDKEVLLMRNPDAVPGGTLVDAYSYNVDKNIIIFPSNYIGLLKDFIIAHHCIHLLIKGAAAKTTGYKVCSFDRESVYRGMRQIYIDALKDEAKKEKKLPVNKLIEMLFILYSQFLEDINELPWSPVTNARVYYIMEQLRKTQLYILLRDGKKDMDEMMEFEDIIPRRYFVLDKAMFYARDLYLAKNLPADQLTPVINIPQMKKFNHLEVKEMLTTRWTHTAWYQSKVFGDAVLKIFENRLTTDWSAPASLEYYADLYKTGVTLTNDLLEYMTMKDWYVWETPRHLAAAQSKQEEYKKDALKRIFGDLIADQL